MGLLDFIERKAVGIAAHRVEERYPMLRRTLDRLVTTAQQPGFKRGLAVVAGMLAILLRHAEGVLTESCTSGLLAGRVCSVHPEGWLPTVDLIRAAIEQLLVPGADLATVAIGLMGLAHAWARGRQAGKA